MQALGGLWFIEAGIRRGHWNVRILRYWFRLLALAAKAQANFALDQTLRSKCAES